MKRIVSLLLVFILHISLLTLTSCNSDKIYSRANMVRCYFVVNQYTQLFNVMGGYGEYATIRSLKSQGKVRMESGIGATEYNLTADMRGYEFGLGGLIVGANYNGEYLAYDLACPNCNRADYRMSIDVSTGIAKCPKCKMAYDLNNYGVISASSTSTVHVEPRGLFRYRIVYDGTTLAVFN